MDSFDSFDVPEPPLATRFNPNRLVDGRAPEQVRATKPSARKVVTITPTTLLSENGFKYLRQRAQEFALGPAGHEIADLSTLMSFYRDWAHRLNANLPFSEFTTKVEKCCRQKTMQLYLSDLKRAIEQGKEEECRFDEKDFLTRAVSGEAKNRLDQIETKEAGAKSKTDMQPADIIQESIPVKHGGYLPNIRQSQAPLQAESTRITLPLSMEDNEQGFTWDDLDDTLSMLQEDSDHDVDIQPVGADTDGK